jgi:hypothetical protein
MKKINNNNSNNKNNINYIYKIIKYFETYSKKKGMIRKSYKYIEIFNSFDEAFNFLKEENINSEFITVKSEKDPFITIKSFSSSGVPVIKQYKIYKVKQLISPTPFSKYCEIIKNI